MCLWTVPICGKKDHRERNKYFSNFQKIINKENAHAMFERVSFYTYVTHKVKTQYVTFGHFRVFFQRINTINDVLSDGRNHFLKRNFYKSGFLGKISLTKQKRSMCQIHQQHDYIITSLKVIWNIFMRVSNKQL